jgi:hypothetical protein
LISALPCKNKETLLSTNCLSGYVRLVHARLTELTAVVAEPRFPTSHDL